MNFVGKSTIIFPLVLLSTLALLTLWINQSVQPPAPRLDGSSRHDPDYIISNFVTTQTDANGELRYKLAATEMKHYPDDDTTNLQRPRYTQYAVNKPYTQVEGLRGYVSNNGEEVQIVDNVKVTRQAFEEKGEMTLETDYLNIRPNEELVQTKSPVVIRQAPKTVIYATGMIYEKKNKTLTLLNKVRAHYEKPLTKAKAAGISGAELANSKALDTKTDTTKPSNSMKSSKINPSDSLKSNITRSDTNDARIRRRYE
jgi:lipopolysaccharide export system protein LptC